VERQGNLALTVGELRSLERIFDCLLDRHVWHEAQLYASSLSPAASPPMPPR
jgi:hypothetical protein